MGTDFNVCSYADVDIDISTWMQGMDIMACLNLYIVSINYFCYEYR